MTKKVTISIITAVIIIMIVTIVIIVKKDSNSEGFPLKQGSTGVNVKTLQKFLNEKNIGFQISVDGDFGAKTESLLFAVTGKKELSKREFNNLIS